MIFPPGPSSTFALIRPARPRARNSRKATAFDSEYRRTHGIDLPAEKGFRRGAAYASLARSHSATRVQLRRAPRIELPGASERNVLAAAEQRFRLWQRLYFLPQLKRRLHRRRKTCAARPL